MRVNEKDVEVVVAYFMVMSYNFFTNKFIQNMCSKLMHIAFRRQA
jgi:hypothetical protein